MPGVLGQRPGDEHRTIQARIPAGVGDGQRIRLKGKGAPGERGGPAGDLYVRVHVAAHPVFGRSGDNLTLTVPVTFAEAALGADIKVPVHEAMPVTLRIPAGTAERPDLPGPRQGRPALATGPSATCWSPSTCGAQAPGRRGQGRAGELPQGDRGRRPAGRAAAAGESRMSTERGMT